VRAGSERVLIIDRMLVGGIKFVLGKIVSAVEAEMNDDSALRDELLAAQMQVELGEMTEEEFIELETDILARIREIREARGEGSAIADISKHKVTGVEADVYEEE
jgi:hypothetical protein